MTILEFHDLKFEESDDKIKVFFLRDYHFYVDKKQFSNIGVFKINKNIIEFDASKKAVTNKFNRILQMGFEDLKDVFGKRTIYVHSNSDIPLVGTNEFGIIDRGTNCVELKPNTGCNLDCVYCSVDAGDSSKKAFDFVVEKDYLISETKKIVLSKKNPVEISINPQGEPLLYEPLFDLVSELKALKGVKTVSVNTNGVLLTKKVIDRFQKAGLDRLNISLNSLNEKICSKLAGKKYPLKRVKEAIDYACNTKKVDIFIAPIIIPKFNDGEKEKIILFCKKRNIRVGFQNFLHYSNGRNPTKPKPMKEFVDELRFLEEKTGFKLFLKAVDFEIFPDKTLKKPFKKGDVIKAKIVSFGKYKTERICVFKDRCITVNVSKPINQIVNIKIVRDKHNIFKGVLK
ncbi:MAG: radical SAM protein [Nanoarchaeota archaeon]|nr:radical SAM protein [Nanoarchaeota archaeon]MBU1029625.1 radical SAM protein [Nanoarchaeota archaeon]MBU1850687.1 radical SAM protein [Nanoarchaeota archaeon]